MAHFNKKIYYMSEKNLRRGEKVKKKRQAIGMGAEGISPAVHE